jgi:hypothetical protein
VSYATIRDVYTAFAELFGSEQPSWSRDQLQDWIQSRGLRYEQVTSEVLDDAFVEAVCDAIDEAVQP